MSNQCQPTHTTIAQPTNARIPRRRFVGWDGELAGAGADCMGVSYEDIEIGDHGMVVMGVTAVVDSGAALDGSAIYLKSDAQGRAIAADVGDTVQAVLKAGQTAAAANKPIEVYPLNAVTPLAI